MNRSMIVAALAIVATPARAQDAAAGKRAFIQCQACHALSPGGSKVGPPLNGVVGRKAASVKGYAYSAPMAKSDLVWDAATLDRFLARPSAAVPGTKMIYAGMPDAARRQALIAFLKAAR